MVEFESRAQAVAAVRALDGSELDGRVLACRPDREYEERAAGGGGGGERREREAPRERSRERPASFRSAAPGGGGSDTCFTCGGVGHKSRDCPSDRGALKGYSGGGGGGGGGGVFDRNRDRAPAPAHGGRDDACRACGQSGHWARDCPSKGERGGGERSGRGGGRGGGGRGPKPDAATLDADMDTYFAQREEPAK